MNNDLISRGALFKTWDALDETQDTNLLVDAMIKATQDAPAVDAEMVRHGRWRPYKQNVECSECHVKWAVDESIAVVYTSIKDLKYCPNCGAKMDGDANA